jgi:hypothetical protein
VIRFTLPKSNRAIIYSGERKLIKNKKQGSPIGKIKCQPTIWQNKLLKPTANLAVQTKPNSDEREELTMQDFYSLSANKLQTVNGWYKQAEQDRLAQEAKQSQPKFFRFFSKPGYQSRTEQVLRASHN